jgi:hypothetical protein
VVAGSCPGLQRERSHRRSHCRPGPCPCTGACGCVNTSIGSLRSCLRWAAAETDGADSYRAPGLGTASSFSMNATFETMDSLYIGNNAQCEYYKILPISFQYSHYYMTLPNTTQYYNIYFNTALFSSILHNVTEYHIIQEFSLVQYCSILPNTAVFRTRYHIIEFNTTSILLNTS